MTKTNNTQIITHLRTAIKQLTKTTTIFRQDQQVTNREFKDVVFEDVVFDNNRFYLIPYYILPNMGSHNYYHQSPHSQTPHP